MGFSPVKACSACASCHCESAVRNCSLCFGSMLYTELEDHCDMNRSCWHVIVRR